jgi:5-methyltetrahydropteroyltriglutamate--homocysteine methyltransferase
LVRTRDIVDGMRARTLGLEYDPEKLESDIERGIGEVVRKQLEVGIDIPNDGEYAREGFTTYIHQRLGGLERREPEPGEDLVGGERVRPLFPEFSWMSERRTRFIWMYPGIDMSMLVNPPANRERFRVRAPIEYIGGASVQKDIDRLRSALQGQTVEDAFITAVTPVSRKNDAGVLDVYRNERDYFYALADAMHQDYKAITDAGFVVQLDYAVLNPQEQFLKSASSTDVELRNAREFGVEITNHALQGIPEDRVRYHHCWGSGNTPHVLDIPLRELAPLLLKINAQAYGVEAANPRHEHEWMVWRDIKLPEGKILIPGLVSQSTNVVEHPDLIAWRIRNFASVVGKENIIVGTDCGFSQSWDLIRLHPSVQWAKLRALSEGAARASAELWRT